MLTLPDYPFQAFIFDCDGTLVDSMPVHYEAWVESLTIHQAPFDFTEEVFYGYAGVREQDVVTQLNISYNSEVDPDAVAHTKAEIFLRRVPEVRA
ncbi:MAG: HAD hydrolase-like protein, partial [Prosthecobacter sp.]|nr:HAD hydrolase-like protein [Prosthecobacter sp.]